MSARCEARGFHAGAVLTVSILGRPDTLLCERHADSFNTGTLRKGLAVAAVVLAAGLSAAPAMSAPDAPGNGRLQACKVEGYNGCVWDAKHMGNGIGRSYIATPDGKVIPVPHYVAHALIFGGAR